MAVQGLDTVEPAILVRYPPISMDWRVLAFTIALTLATSLLFGAAPALSAAGVRIQEVLKSGSQTHSLGRGAVRLRKALLVAELGVSLVLLIGAGLLARSFLKLARTELGFRSDHLLTFRVRTTNAFDRNYRGLVLLAVARPDEAVADGAFGSTARGYSAKRRGFPSDWPDSCYGTPALTIHGATGCGQHGC